MQHGFAEEFEVLHCLHNEVIGRAKKRDAQQENKYSKDLKDLFYFQSSFPTIGINSVYMLLFGL